MGFQRTAVMREDPFPVPDRSPGRGMAGRRRLPPVASVTVLMPGYVDDEWHTGGGGQDAAVAGWSAAVSRP